MLFVTYPMMLVALVPIILVETVVFSRAFHAEFRLVAWRVGLANAASTIVGIPLTWLLWVGLILLTDGGRAHGLATLRDRIVAVTWQGAWLIPYESELYWMIPAAALVGLVPAFFASVGIEGVLVTRLWRAAEQHRLWRLTWVANAASYGVLFGLAGGWLACRLLSPQ